LQNTATIEGLLAPCRAILVECAADATELSVLHISSPHVRLREHAKSALLCAHACTRTLRLILHARAADVQSIANELRMVGSLFATCAIELRDWANADATLQAWQATCERAAATCSAASSRVAGHPRHSGTGGRLQ
jgi:hypothetical protein